MNKNRYAMDLEVGNIILVNNEEKEITYIDCDLERYIVKICFKDESINVVYNKVFNVVFDNILSRI